MSVLKRALGGLLVTVVVSAPVQARAVEARTNASICQFSPSSPLNIGFSITHTRVAPNAEALCTAQGGGADLSGRDAVIANYNDPAVRQTVIATLDALRQDGAAVVRTAFWIRSAEDLALQRAQPANRLGLLISHGGRLPEQYGLNLAQFAADVQRAGYRQLFIAIGNLGRSKPACRNHPDEGWGTCYDSRFDALTWSAMEQIIRTVKSRQPPGLDVVFDIAGEYCFIHDPDSLLQSNLEHYVRFMVQHYQAAFGDNKYMVSCIGGDLRRTLSELRDTESFFAQLQHRPAFIDVHLYTTGRDQIRQGLAAADATARRLGIPLMIGETFADDHALFSTIKQMRSQGQLTALRDVLVWPRRIGSKCQIDMDAREVLPWVVPDLGQR